MKDKMILAFFLAYCLLFGGCGKVSDIKVDRSHQTQSMQILFVEGDGGSLLPSKRYTVTPGKQEDALKALQFLSEQNLLNQAAMVEVRTREGETSKESLYYYPGSDTNVTKFFGKILRCIENQ